MSENKNLKASRHLTHGDLFTYRGEWAVFLHYTGALKNTRYGLYQDAWVNTEDGAVVKWSLNQAGSVETL